MDPIFEQSQSVILNFVFLFGFLTICVFIVGILIYYYEKFKRKKK